MELDEEVKTYTALAQHLEFDESLTALRIQDGVSYARIDTVTWAVPKVRVGLRASHLHLIPTFPVSMSHPEYGLIPVAIVYEL